MPKKYFAVDAVAGIALLAGSALAGASDQPGHVSPRAGTNTNAISAAKDMTAKAVGMISAEMTHSSKALVEAASISDMYEIEAANIALQRSTNPKVKEFANAMLRDHGKSSMMLKDTLARANVGGAPAGHLDDRRQGMIDDLRGAGGRDFDTCYLAQQVGAHQEAKILLRGYARSGDNGALKRFAQTILPKVQMHLAMAETAQNAIRNHSAS